MSVGFVTTEEASVNSLLLPEMQAFLRYEDLSGESPANVFLPGLMIASHPTFTSIVHKRPTLLKQRSIFVDLLGSGFSDAPHDFGYSLEEHASIIARLLDELDIKGCSVVGYSMGGAVGITLASIRPDLVSRLVLMEANLDPGGGLASKGIAEQTEEAFCAHGFQAFTKYLRDEGIAGDTTSAALAGLIQIAAPHALYRSAVGLVIGTQPTMRERLLQMDIPRAYIFGEESLPDPDWDRLGSQGVQVLVVADAGHGMAWDNPAGVAEALHTAMTT
jgi:pimeloyl-ACP methyl ester carboxylesterase